VIDRFLAFGPTTTSLQVRLLHPRDSALQQRDQFGLHEVVAIGHIKTDYLLSRVVSADRAWVTTRKLEMTSITVPNAECGYVGGQVVEVSRWNLRLAPERVSC